MNLIRIESSINSIVCPLCKSENSTHHARIEEVPAFLGCVDSRIEEDQFITYDVFICRDCGMISTSAIFDEVSYQHLHSEAVGTIWNKHHEALAKFTQTFLKENAQLLEIGPSSSPISRRLITKPANVTYLDLLDCLPFELESHEQYFKMRFPHREMKFAVNGVIASHVFEHTYDMHEFLLSAANSIGKGESFVISIPNFEKWISNLFWNAITPEHTVYPFVEHLRWLVAEIGLSLSIENYLDHSIFAAFSKQEVQAEPIESEELVRLVNKSEQILTTWTKYILSSIQKSERELERSLLHHPHDAVCIAGASHLAQYPILMSPSLRDKVDFVIDNSPSKDGKRLYGTQVFSRRFETLSDYLNPVVIVFRSSYQEEMISQIKSINSRATVITNNELELN